MEYRDTLLHCLMYIAAECPDSVLDVTEHAVNMGLLNQSSMDYLKALQELAERVPMLLECSAVVKSTPTKEMKERHGTISLVGEAKALFIFRDEHAGHAH